MGCATSSAFAGESKKKPCDTAVVVCTPKSYPAENRQTAYEMTPEATAALSLSSPSASSFDGAVHGGLLSPTAKSEVPSLELDTVMQSSLVFSGSMSVNSRTRSPRLTSFASASITFANPKMSPKALKRAGLAALPHESELVVTDVPLDIGKYDDQVLTESVPKKKKSVLSRDEVRLPPAFVR